MPSLGVASRICHDVVHRMAQRDDLERRRRRRNARQRLEFFGFQRALDGAQPVGTLGMAEWGEVFETGGVGDQQSGHRRQWARFGASHT